MTAPRADDAPWWRGRTVPLARRMLAHDRARLVTTVGGVAVATALLLFLLALHEGVAAESNGWVRTRPVAAWVAQEESDNFIKSSSAIPLAWLDSARAVAGVAEATPVLRFITVLAARGRRSNAIVVGIDPASPLARPAVTAGRDAPGAGGIVLDRALAARLGVGLGDTVRLLRTPFRVAGLATGTNAVLVQLAFVRLDDAWPLVPLRGIASDLLVRAAPGVPDASLVARLRARLPRANVLAGADFTAANLRELQGGLLPILATVAVLGALVGAAVLALLMQGAVLEHRASYALLKAIGADDARLARLVVAQALLAASAGVLAGTALYLAGAPVARALVPVLALALPWRAPAYVAAATLAIAAGASLVPLRRVRALHPAELFRA